MLVPFVFYWDVRQGRGQSSSLLSGSHKSRDIDFKRLHTNWHHHLYLGLYNLRPKHERIDGALSP
jgi:hypothetical protein